MTTKRIAVLGGPRCGKTTLIQHLYVEMKIFFINKLIIICIKITIVIVIATITWFIMYIQ